MASQLRALDRLAEPHFQQIRVVDALARYHLALAGRFRKGLLTGPYRLARNRRQRASPRAARPMPIKAIVPGSGAEPPREQVQKLLEAEDAPSLRSPVAGVLAPPAPPVAVGRYRIVRLLGEGGMGAVYEAEQDHPRRTVDLKVIRSGLASPELLRRFEHEAQALAGVYCKEPKQEYK